MLQQESVINQNNTKTVNIDVSFNNTVFEKKSDFGKNAFILRRQKYPDLRFACPNCGTLDVLIEWARFVTLKGHCLDCKIDWY
jgi:predicted RNA-binding Zn-ribbon protein involved in translation (DUF1610 family)